MESRRRGGLGACGDALAIHKNLRRAIDAKLLSLTHGGADGGFVCLAIQASSFASFTIGLFADDAGLFVQRGEGLLRVVAIAVDLVAVAVRVVDECQ